MQNIFSALKGFLAHVPLSEDYSIRTGLKDDTYEKIELKVAAKSCLEGA